MTKFTKSERQVRYEGLRSALIQSGLGKSLFPLNLEGKDIKSVDVKIREIKNSNPDLKIMLGDINFYAEKILLCTTKKSLAETHRIFATNTRRYWCQYLGIEPRVESNQGQNAGKEKGDDNKSYGINCLLNVEQSIQMFCYLLRFRISVGNEERIPLEKFTDLATLIFLDFLEKGKKECVWALDDTGLGKVDITSSPQGDGN
ncbi:hypothetical protein [Dolichospermum compactum]|uniref:Uncharacterized protein n=1 Tax=Dolichospermum compactum NIES-806 TaxID=1973481 RepID=A0A1Z4V2W1_9CYAN|nr:hypothetical protein [Dolichospermum compactum]BAZ85774.1 hypothetical protein NIES806_19780 [Dolichospermum compactum NIES-806]